MVVRTPDTSPNSTDSAYTDDPRSSYGFPPAYESRSLIVEAISRSKWIMLLLAVVLAGAGVAVGYKRKPTWSASSTLEVGANINPNSPGFSSFVQSATSLATTFSREITATDVLNRIHNKTKLSPVAAAGRVTATPIPDGAAIKVIATGPTSSAAIKLANTAASALVAHESGNNFSSAAPAIYRSYQAQASLLAHDKARLQRLQNAPAQSAVGSTSTTSSIGSTSTTSAANPALVQAQADVSSAQARANALSTAYTQAIVAQPSASTDLLTPLATAVTATSDRIHKIELLGFVGLAAGLLLGGAIAILREQRRSRRIIKSHH
jgi:capsular polysaccharide biosynthesis protein